MTVHELEAATDRPPRGPATFCVVAADAARARVLVLDGEPGAGGAAGGELTELAEITNPMLRVRGAAPGGNGRRGRTPPQGVPEFRDHRRDIDRHFAAEIAEEAAAVWSCYPGCALIVAASPTMLALLRPALEHKIGALPRGRVHELARELARVSGPRLHDELAAAGLVPPRPQPAAGAATQSVG